MSVLIQTFAAPISNGAEPTPESAQQWISLNSYAARLLEIRFGYWTHLAVWTLKTALEQPPKAYKPSLNCAVAAAAEWIIHSGYFIFGRLTELGKDGKSGEGRGEEDESIGVGVGPLFGGKAGLTMERWHFWKQRFGEVRKLLDAQAKKQATKAQMRMNEIEQTRIQSLDNV